MDLMIDIETLGVKTEAPVISIGACFFDKDGIKNKFYAVLDVEQQIDSGLRKVDGSTIKWWMGQEGAAQKVFKEEIGVLTGKHVLEYMTEEDQPREYEAVIRHGKKSNLAILMSFVGFILGEYQDYDANKAKPWGNGSNFDITILESLFKSYKIKTPWNFRNIRDFRTFKEYVYDGADTERVGTYHNALDDAIYQAQVVIDGLNKKIIINKTEFDGIIEKESKLETLLRKAKEATGNLWTRKGK